YTDRIEVRVEIGDGINIDNFVETDRLRQSVSSRLRAACQLDMKVMLVSPNSLKRFEGKARRVTDTRDLLGGQ
ncbi:MAG: phenylacetate--CoA ligase, partial [Christensenellaceae bacterium]|nr:phenylacetate--CoA ligase [Christensenellaceae bacterium]